MTLDGDRIEISDHTLRCIIGMLPDERVNEQRLVVDLQLFFDIAAAGRGDLKASIDYAQVKRQVEFLAVEGRWLLLESLAMACCRLLLAAPNQEEGRAAADAMRIRLRKPDIFAGEATPGVVAERRVHQLSWASVDLGRGLQAQVLEQTGEAGAYRLRLSSGTSWEVPRDAALLILGGVAFCGDTPLRSGDVIERTQNEREILSQGPLTLLMVATPPLATEQIP